MRQRGFISAIWLYAGAALIFAGLGLAVKVQTSRLAAAKEETAQVQASFEAFKTQVELAGRAAVARAEAEAERNRKVNQERNSSYEKRISDLASRYQRLLGNGASSSGVPSVPSAARPVDDPARDQRLLEVLRYAEEQTARLIELQQWVKEQAAKPAAGP
jgi:hypothetical protein